MLFTSYSQWHRTHRLNGRITRSTRGGGARKFHRRATTVTPNSGRREWDIGCGEAVRIVGFSQIHIGTNLWRGTKRRASLGKEKGFSARVWQTYSNVAA